MLKLALLVALVPVLSFAEVADVSDAGFSVKVEKTIQAPPVLVYARIVQNVGDWWNPKHTFTGNSHALSIDDKPLGCFCEGRTTGTGAIRHMEVINNEVGKTLVMTGALGPLQGLAVTATLSIQLSPAGDGTKLLAVYNVGGYQPHGLTSWAGPVDSVVTEQFTRLKNYIETGKPENEKAAPK
ncbi:MAG TPA: hypothetical protein VFW44_12350 [Bryobacteraceae bacterium]|nr:hypothetical protein [Bryobacteraceae bacterium]